MATILLLLFLPPAYSDLGNEDFAVREEAQKRLSNPIAASLLPMPHTIDNPEIRNRVTELKTKYAWFQFPELVEKRAFHKDFTAWFWTYAFEGRSHWSDTQIHDQILAQDSETVPEMAIIIDALQRDYPWITGTVYHMYGSGNDKLVTEMRAHFDFYNEKGKARRSVIGGLYGAFVP